MAKQQTKKVKLADLFYHAQMDLPRHMFTDWLSYCYGIFEAVAGNGRRIDRVDIAMIAKDLADNLEKAGFKKQECKFCGSLCDHEFCNEGHAIAYQSKMDRQVEQEFGLSGKAV